MCRKSQVILIVLLLLSPLAAGCSTVEYYEKQNLQDAAMQFEGDPSEVHFQAKVYYSMEGSAGGIGDSGGGGCGCY
ncbi:MAG: DUF4266 domain-containing protein [Planctomycetes bacterium]|jgi:hypothetical protein|nr:DUF4266 domain-containing protein [Planctomycetota bacterium]MBT6541311.1 DUF4266 domain-containing protein [Planctomycetota bacterium]MBT6968627.1 DUF4266 domain-containing protein [Planctomycetota bacterium]